MVPDAHPLILWFDTGLITCDSPDVCENQSHTRRFTSGSRKGCHHVSTKYPGKSKSRFNIVENATFHNLHCLPFVWTCGWRLNLI